MRSGQDRFVEVRLLVLVSVKLADEELLELIRRQQGGATVADVIAAEVMSNLESLSYIEVAIATQL